MVIRLLAVFAEHLSTFSNRLSLGRNLTGSRVIAKSCAYIAENHGEPIRLRDVARAVGTTFRYSKLKIAPAQRGPQGRIELSCDVTNTGERAGDEVVQL